MFPVLNLENVQATQNNTIPASGKVFKFDFAKNEYVIKDGKLVEITRDEAVKQFITWVLKTQITKFKIYPEDYGIDRDTFIGQKKLPQGFINSELKRQIQEQLTRHELIESVTNFTHSRKNDLLVIEFTVLTTYGTISISEVI